MKVKCELCPRAIVLSAGAEETTVCRTCDGKMKREYEDADRKAAEAHAAKYKCQKCGHGLPVSRRLTCKKCLPEDHRPTEDQYGNLTYRDAVPPTPGQVARAAQARAAKRAKAARASGS